MDRKLEFGSTFSRVFDLYGRYAAPLLIWAAAVQLVMSLLVALLLTSIVSGVGVGTTLLGIGLVGGFAVVANSVLTGAYIVGLSDAEQTGTFPAFGATWGRVGARLLPLIGTSILAGLGIGFGMLLLLVPGLLLMTWWAVIAPVVVLEGKGGPDALGRSRELVRGNGWTVFGLLVVVMILTQVASGIIGSIVGAILGGRDEFLGIFGSQFVSGTLLTPIAALLAVVIYWGLTGPEAGPRDQAMQPPLAQPTTPPPADSTSSGPFV